MGPSWSNMVFFCSGFRMGPIMVQHGFLLFWLQNGPIMVQHGFLLFWLQNGPIMVQHGFLLFWLQNVVIMVQHGFLLFWLQNGAHHGPTWFSFLLASEWGPSWSNMVFFCSSFISSSFSALGRHYDSGLSRVPSFIF